MKSERLKYLFNRYFNREIQNAEEEEELMEMLDYDPNDAETEALLEAAWQRYSPAETELLNSDAEGKIWQNVQAETGLNRRGRVISKARRMAVAATIMIAVAGTLYFTLRPTDIQKNGDLVSAKNDIGPGGQKAILTLADGKTVVLDTAANGQLTMQGQTSVDKTAAGQIVYTGGASREVFMNTLSTPRGGKYNVVLPDGTAVWLNAESSISFPTTFSTGRREVSITGEAYFEVAKNPSMPFVVKVAGGSKVEVLGTHFNIMSYANEPSVQTTLFEGSVRVSENNATVVLEPGQQASIKGAGVQVADNVNLEQVMAWKNGEFNFNQTDLRTIMRQVARWYDVEVEYRGNIESSLNGHISSNVNLSEVLKILEIASSFNFRVEGRKIIISKE